MSNIKVSLFSKSEKLYFNCMSNNSRRSYYITSLFRISSMSNNEEGLDFRLNKHISLSQFIKTNIHIINQKYLDMEIVKIPFTNRFRRKKIKIFPLIVNSFRNNIKLSDYNKI